MTKNLENAFRDLSDDLSDKNPPLSGLLGITINGARTVEVPTRNTYVYVRLRDNTSELIQAFNDAVSPVYDLPVTVKRDGNKYKILGRDTQRYGDWGSFSSFLPRHGTQHSFDPDNGGGGDTVFVFPRQFMPSLVIPSGTLGGPNVVISRFIEQQADGNWRALGDTGTANLSPVYNPTGNNAVMVLVYEDTVTGNYDFIVNSGTYFANTITGTAEVAPFIPTLDDEPLRPLSAIRLISGTNSIGWDNIYDVRQFMTSEKFTGTFIDEDAFLKLDAANDPVTGRLDIVTAGPFASPTPAALRLFASGTNEGGLQVISRAGGAIYAQSNGNGGQIVGDFESYPSGTSATQGVLFVYREPGGGTPNFLAPMIDAREDDGAGVLYGGILRGIVRGNTRLWLNPTATGTSPSYLFDTEYTRPTGTKIASVRHQGAEVFYVGRDGDVCISGSYIQQGVLLDDRYLMLDASNDPITGNLLLKPTADSTTAFQVQQSDTTVVFNVDTTNRMVTVENDTGIALQVNKSTGGVGFEAKSTDATAGISARFNSRSGNGLQARFTFLTLTSGGANAGGLFGHDGGDNVLFLNNSTDSIDRHLTIDTSGQVGIGVTAPLTKLHVHGSGTIIRLRNTDSDINAPTRTMPGLELLVHSVQNNDYGTAIKWMSTDPDLTTENPKLLAHILPQATQVIDGDADGGTDLVFGVTPKNPGVTNVPVEAFRVRGAGGFLATGGSQITGNADTQQLIVQANATQTANVVEIQDSVGNVQVSIDGSGGAIFNDEGNAAADFIIETDNEDKHFYVDGGLDVTRIGDYDTNYIEVDKAGDTWWVGGGGLVFGSMYAGAEIAVVINDNNPTEVEDAGEDGWTAGELNLVTFPTGGTEHYLTITKPGKYEISWNMSFHIDTPGANVEIHGGVMIDGSATMGNGEAHRTVANVSDTGNMSAPCIADLPNGNEEISLWIQNATNTANIDVVHATVTLKLIGGT